MTGRGLAAAVVVLLGCVLFCPPLQARSARSLYGEANRAFWDEEYDTAVAKFRRFLDRHSGHSLRWDAHFGLARALNKLNRLDASLRHYRLVQRNHPNRALRGDALFAEFEIAVARNRPERARELLESFLNRFSDHALVPTARKQLRLLRPDTTGPGQDAGQARDTDPSTTSPGNEPGERADRADTPSRPADPSGDRSGEYPRPPDRAASPEVEPDARSRPEPPPGARSSPERVFPDESVSSPSPGDEDAPKRGDEPRRSGDFSAGDAELRERLRALRSRVQRQREALEDLRSTVQRFRTRTALLKKEKDRLKRQRDRLRRRLVEADRALPGEGSGGEPGTGRAGEPRTDRNGLTPGGTPTEGPGSPTDVADVSESGTSASVPGSLTEMQLRRRVERNRRQGNFARASRLQERLLERSPSAEDHYRAARLHRSAGQRPKRVLRHLESAVEASDTVPVKYLLLEAQVYLETNRLRAFDRLIEQHGERMENLGDPERRSRYFYLRGRRLLRSGEEDAGFFEFMESIRAAPDSRWARMSRRVVKSEL